MDGPNDTVQTGRGWSQRPERPWMVRADDQMDGWHDLDEFEWSDGKTRRIGVVKIKIQRIGMVEEQMPDELGWSGGRYQTSLNDQMAKFRGVGMVRREHLKRWNGQIAEMRGVGIIKEQNPHDLGWSAEGVSDRKIQRG